MVLSKWVIYFLTLTTYATFHSIRSAWATLKTTLSEAPFNYEKGFLGILQINIIGLLDMIVLFTLAVGLSTVGNKVEKYGPKRCLLISMLLIIMLTTLIGVLLLVQVTQKAVYFILFGMGVGLLSIALPLWNGTSQLGDLIALFVNDVVVERVNFNGGLTLIIIPIIMLIIWTLNLKYLPADIKDKKNQPRTSGNGEMKSGDIPQLNEQQQVPYQQVNGKRVTDLRKSQDNLNVALNGEYKSQQSSNENEQQQGSNPNKKDDINAEKVVDSILTTADTSYSHRPVSFITVWCLPGVALYITAYAFIKAINSIIMAWLVFYLSSPTMNMQQQSRLIAVLWAIGVFGGGIIGGRINRTYSRQTFIACLLIAAGLFAILEEMKQKIFEVEIIIAVLLCGLAYGGPYNMMSTAVPIMLGDRPEITNRKGAKTAIISTMSGFGQFMAGVSILLVPAVGVDNIHWLELAYCLIACSILILAILLERRAKKRAQAADQLKHQTDRQQANQIC